jgi:hypothetical protein
MRFTENCEKYVRMEQQLDSHMTDFNKILYLKIFFFSKICREISSFI